MMRDDFGIFILTHGRADNVQTFKTLNKYGYTGKLFIVIDDGDLQIGEYQKRFGKLVRIFSKEQIARQMDEANTWGKRGSVVFARNACWELARQEGLKYFMQLDDDYSSFCYRAFSDSSIVTPVIATKHTFSQLVAALVEFVASTDVLAMATSQGGDWISGANQMKPRPNGNSAVIRRKAMNSFVCAVDRPFTFQGLINEDVNTVVSLSRRGKIFFTTMQAMLVQMATQSNAGGMTDWYKQSGTYIKSFYSILFEPSCVQIGVLADYHANIVRPRFHHHINWNATAVRIIAEKHRKALS